MMTHLSLFSGIGGLDLAAEAAGFTTVGQCEWADYPTKVLEKHWPDVPRWRDIRTLTGDNFYERTGLRTVDVVSGGFPCQPFSVAGKQKVKDDNRYLWPEMLRVIREITPSWVLGENVPGILRIAAWDVVADLEREGYNVAVFDYEAAAVGAPHRRERVCFVGYTEHNGLSSTTVARIVDTSCKYGEEGPYTSVKPQKTSGRGNDADVAHTNGERLERRYGESVRERPGKLSARESGSFACEGGINTRTQWHVEPDVGRVAHGIPNRVDRLKCLGNAVVPQQFYPIFKAIYDIETGECN